MAGHLCLANPLGFMLFRSVLSFITTLGGKSWGQRPPRAISIDLLLTEFVLFCCCCCFVLCFFVLFCFKLVILFDYLWLFEARFLCVALPVLSSPSRPGWPLIPGSPASTSQVL